MIYQVIAYDKMTPGFPPQIMSPRTSAANPGPAVNPGPAASGDLFDFPAPIRDRFPRPNRRPAEDATGQAAVARVMGEWE